jgi:drug/metabolite transporter (DMT)-like permease
MSTAAASSGRALAHLLAFAGILIISFSAIFVRLAAVSPATATFFRAAYAVPLLAAVWWYGRRREAGGSRSRGYAVLAGVILAGDLTLWHLAIANIGAGLATVIANVQVLVVGLAAWVLYRERPTGLAFLLVPMVIGGVTLISGLGRADAYGAHPGRGVLFGVLAGISYAAFLLVFRSSSVGSRWPAGPLLDATLGTAAGALVIGPLLDPAFSLAVTWPAHAWLAALALAPQAVGWLFLTAALPRLPALETSVLLLGQPLLTVLWAFMLFDEALSRMQWTGATLVLAGVGLLSMRGSVKSRDERSSGERA